VLRREPAGAIVVQAVTPNAISATAIRAALARGACGEVRGLLPPAVLAYIQTNRLYGPRPQDAT
jgi:nicotinic acid mononucleotide adenylyltransferase